MMHDSVSFNHEITPQSETNLSAVSSLSLYGKGIFTTIAVYDSEPFLWEKHWRRLKSNADKVGVDLSDFNQSSVRESLFELIGHNLLTKGKCRITFFDESSSTIWKTSNNNSTSLLIQTADFDEPKKNLSLTVSAFICNSNSPLAGVKSCNYLDKILALEAAKRGGYDEAIRFNERNEVVSGCTANIFWKERNRDDLFTPSVKTGCLNGTTRELVLERHRVIEVEKEINTLLRDAETIFLTSSVVGVVQVSDIDRELRLNDKPHELTHLIERELDQ